MAVDKKTSLNDLPNEILFDIFKYLDFPETFKLRLNKRLDKLQLSTRHAIRNVNIKICESDYIIQINWKSNNQKLEADSFNSSLRRIARVTRVNSIHFEVNTRMENQDTISQCVDTLSHFNADSIFIYINEEIELPEITLIGFMNLVNTTERVEICANFSTITAEHLCQIRKVVVDQARENAHFSVNACEMKYFRMRVNQEMAHSFLKTCFGVTIDETEDIRDSRLYRAENESLEMFSYNPRQTEFVIFEGAIYTEISALASFIRFIHDGDKNEPDPVIHKKILWNRRYY